MAEHRQTSITLSRDRAGQIERRIYGGGFDFTLTAGLWQRVLRARDRAKLTGHSQRIMSTGGRPHQLCVSRTHVGVCDVTTGAATVVSLGALLEDRPEREKVA